MTDSYRKADPDDPTEVAREGPPPSGQRPGAPRRVAGYELLEELGRGGAGVVHRAQHVTLGKVVALKILEGGSEQEVARFVQEARAMAALEHPNVVRVHDVGEALGRWFIVMDFAPGGTLAGAVRSARATAKPGEAVVPLEQALALVEKVARGVAHAHERGIVHRDLKPSNVLLSGTGEPLVADFGLARRLDGGEGLTLSGQVLGTPVYMPPEQARGEPVHVTADVYTLGAILQELLTGEPPLASTGKIGLDLQRAASAERTPPRARVPSLPVDLETVLLRALALEPTERYPTALAFAEDLARLRRGERVEARRPSLVTRAARWARLRRATLALSILAGVAVGTTVLLLKEKLAELRSWEVVGRFDGASLAGWERLDGAWKVEEGTLRGQGRPARLALATPLAGDVRVDYVARLLPVAGRAGGDLSLEILPEGTADEDSGYFVGFGSGGNMVAKVGRQGRRVAYLEGAHPTPGATHRIRVERDGTTLRLFVDGALLLEHRDLIPLDLGQRVRVALYTWDADARFSEVTVSRRPAARRARRSEIADGLLEKGQPDAAALLYEEAATDPALSVAERRELALKHGLAEVSAASAAPPDAGAMEGSRGVLAARLARAAAVLAPIVREVPGTELALRAELGLAECDLIRGDLAAALARARAALALLLPSARDAVRELVARGEARCALRGRHDARIALLDETRALFAGNTQVEFECDTAHAQSLLELGRAKDAFALLERAIAAKKGDPFYEPELLLELASARARANDLAEARAVIGRYAAAVAGAGDEQRIRGCVEGAVAALDADDLEGAVAPVREARVLAGRVPGHGGVVRTLELRLELARASGARRLEVLAALDETARAGLAPGAVEWVRGWAGHAALAAAASRLAAGEEADARRALAALTSWQGGLPMPATAALLLAATLDERAGDREAALRALDRATSGAARAPHLAAVARALVQGPVAPDAARRLLASCGECRRDRALAALVLGAFARARGDEDGRALLELAAAEDSPALLRALARALRGPG